MPPRSKAVELVMEEVRHAALVARQQQREGACPEQQAVRPAEEVKGLSQRSRPFGWQPVAEALALAGLCCCQAPWAPQIIAPWAPIC